MGCKNISDTDNNRGSWNHFKITQRVPEEQTGKARNQESTKNSHIVHRTLTEVNADVKVQNMFNLRNNITCTTNCKYRTTVTLFTLGIWFV